MTGTLPLYRLPPALLALALVVLTLISACVTEPLAQPEADPACREPHSPEFVACQFYGRYLTLRPEGLPGETALEVLNPFITESLDALLYNTLVARDAWQRDHPDRPPLLAEGALFTGPALHPDHFVVLGRVPISTRHVGVEIGLSHGDRQWRDIAIMALTDDGFLLDDVYFGDDSYLRDRLP
ncbi:hypothetical protein [Isoalcanivorax indicus]|uniref:hypothetical protein n=1 Tax=Isoalcanivorax indicus TaxID=2202653 RepID=UPI000DB9B8D9|nr:hypothetical protein [Isoalcanivorax indicus]